MLTQRLFANAVCTQGKKFTLESLLGPRGADLVPLYQGGAVCIARLAPQDYHRWHMPVTGVLGPRYRISGALYTINPVAVRQKLDVYTENEREVRRPMELSSNETLIFSVVRVRCA